jgi:hypothetical protein
MAEHPEARPRDVFEAYLSHLPSRTYVESCEYHTERGCALPRHMRARKCNEFCCGGLLGLREGLAEVKATRGFAVATAEQEVIRTVIVDESGVRDVPGAGLG